MDGALPAHSSGRKALDLLDAELPTTHPGAFVGGVDDLFVDLFVTAIAADTLSVKTSQSTVRGFTTRGAT